MNISKYNKENLELLVAELKLSNAVLLPIIGKDISDDLSDDKFFNVLKGKRQATEDVQWNLNKIEELENKINGTVQTEEIKKPHNRAKQFAETK